MNGDQEGRLTVEFQDTTSQLKKRATSPEDGSRNVDVDDQLASFSRTDGLEDTLPSLNSTRKFLETSTLEERALDSEEVLGRRLAHQVIEERDASQDVVVKVALTTNERVKDLHRNDSRGLANDNTMLVVGLVLARLLTCCKS